MSTLLYLLNGSILIRLKWHENYIGGISSFQINRNSDFLIKLVFQFYDKKHFFSELIIF